jgi:VWFA-related protein
MVQEGYGQTALNDAVAATPKLVDENATGRKAIVLITDGVDNASRLTVHEAITTARRVEVPIFTVGFSTLPWEERKTRKDLGTNMAVLKLFADQTGGDTFIVQDPDELKEAVDHISRSLRHQYLIGYSPGLQNWDGRFRSIQLQAGNGRYLVRTRKGYYANP